MIKNPPFVIGVAVMKIVMECVCKLAVVVSAF